MSMHSLLPRRRLTTSVGTADAPNGPKKENRSQRNKNSRGILPCPNLKRKLRCCLKMPDVFDCKCDIISIFNINYNI